MPAGPAQPESGGSPQQPAIPGVPQAAHAVASAAWGGRNPLESLRAQAGVPSPDDAEKAGIIGSMTGLTDGQRKVLEGFGFGVGILKDLAKTNPVDVLRLMQEFQKGQAESSRTGGGGRPPELPGVPEANRGPEWLTSPERGRWLVEEFLRYRLTMAYEVRYNAENGPRFQWICDQIDAYVDAISETRNDRDEFGPHKAFPKPPERKIITNEDGEKVLEDFKPPEFLPKPKEIERVGQVIEELHKGYVLEGAQLPDQPEETHYSHEDLATKDGETIFVETFWDQYKKSDSRHKPDGTLKTPQELRNSLKEGTVALAQVDVYIRQAKTKGLLREVDKVLNSLYQQITQPGISPQHIRALLKDGTVEATDAAQHEFQEKASENEDLVVYAGVEDAYIALAIRTMERSLRGESQPRREGEWLTPSAEQASKGKKETYWTTGSWPKYYQISAETEDQFLIAKDTFFKMIRTAGLGKSPDAVYEHIQNFIEMFKSHGSHEVAKGHISEGFLTDNRIELEALLYVFVGNYSNEVYNHKQRYDAMMAMSKDEGPARWVGIYRSGKGGVAAFTEMFDMEALMDIFNNPVGERGELTIASGHFLQDMIQEIVTERGMGIVLKDYDPREPYLTSDDLEAKIYAAKELELIKSKLGKYKRGIRDNNLKLEDIELDDKTLQDLKRKQVITEGKNGRIEIRRGCTAEWLLSDRDQKRLGDFRSNLKWLGLTDSHEGFKRLYEGFDKGDTHINNYLRFKKAQEEDKDKPEGQKQFHLEDLPESIRGSIDLGRIQLEVQSIRKKIIEGEITPEKGQRAVDLLEDPRDRAVYQEAFSEAAANFDVAFQMQGVLGEKGRRGRGFLYADRNEHIRFYFELGDRLRMEGKNINKLSTKDRDDLWNSFSDTQKRSYQIGWMLSKLRDKAGDKAGEDIPLATLLTSFSQKWQDFYRGLPDKDKEDFVDNIPVYQGENFVQWGVFWTKMKYADDSEVWNKEALWNDAIAQRIKAKNTAEGRDELENFKAKYRTAKATEARYRLAEQLRTRGLQALLTSDEIGPDGQPKIMTYKRPLGLMDTSRIDLLTGKLKKFKNGEVVGYSQAGQEIRLSFDENGRPRGLEFDSDGKVIIYDEASGENRKRILYDSINVDTRARLHAESGVFVEEVKATFQFAAFSDDFRNRYSVDTYLFYQGNKKHPMLAKRITKAAHRIRDGVSRPEDEDKLATTRLIVDPTMCRIWKMPDCQQQRETDLIAAAILESFEGRQRTRHAVHRAFMPMDGFIGRMRTGYRNEDWAGYDRFTMGIEECIGQQPERYARRAKAVAANLPMEHDSAASRWGVHGIGGAVKTMADEIKYITHQPITSQFGLTKIFEEYKLAVDMLNYLVGYTDPQTGKHVFGWLEKSTDNNEKTQRNYVDYVKKTDLLTEPSLTIPFLFEYLEIFGRLTKLTQLMRVMYSNNDNSSGTLNLEEVDIRLRDGSFNTDIETDNTLRAENGIARNRQNAFLDGEEDLYIGDGWERYKWQGVWNWIPDKKPGGGGVMYPKEQEYNALLHQSYNEYSDGKLQNAGPVKDFVRDKII